MTRGFPLWVIYWTVLCVLFIFSISIFMLRNVGGKWRLIGIWRRCLFFPLLSYVVNNTIFQKKKVPSHFKLARLWDGFAYRYSGSISSASLSHMWVHLPTVLLSTSMPDFLYPFNRPIPTGINCAAKRIRPSFLKCILVISGSVLRLWLNLQQLSFYPETLAKSAAIPCSKCDMLCLQSFGYPMMQQCDL